MTIENPEENKKSKLTNPEIQKQIQNIEAIGGAYDSLLEMAFDRLQLKIVLLKIEAYHSEFLRSNNITDEGELFKLKISFGEAEDTIKEINDQISDLVLKGIEMKVWKEKLEVSQQEFNK